MLGELYRTNGGWRFMAVDQGFNGGLDALVRHFGGSADDLLMTEYPSWLKLAAQHGLL